MSKEEEVGGWSTIDTSRKQEPEKVEFEIEEAKQEAKTPDLEVDPQEAKTERKPEVASAQQKKEAAPVNKPTGNEEEKELEGINTAGAQKRIRQLIRQRKERDEEISRLRAEKEQALALVRTRDTELMESVKTTIDTTEGQLASRIESAKRSLKAAVDQSDTDAIVAAQEELAKSYADAATVRERKRAFEDYQQRQEEEAKRAAATQQRAPQQPQYDPRAVQWAANNDWFGKDQIMTQAALAVDAELKGEGFDPSDDEYYDEVDRRLAERFPDRLVRDEEASAVEKKEPPQRLQDAPSNPARKQVVAGASRTPKTSTSSNAPRVKLTQEDVRLANKWGIPLEKYAAEKLKVEQAGGEYTTI